MQVSAASFGQRITLDQRNTPLKTVLKEIRKQSGYDVFSDARTVLSDQKVTVVITNATLDEALVSSLKGLNLTYEINNKIVTIKRKEDPSFIEALVSRFRNIHVEGKVMDENGFVLAGASIWVKGTEIRTVSDENGRFYIPDADKNAVLVISYIGYTALEVDLKDAPIPLEVHLNMSTGKLEEVRVAINTGYQRILPQQMTGAVSQISTRAYESRISTDFLSGLQNKLPGLLINNNIQFQGNNLFQIRGISTMTGNPTPLIVLDGYPTDLSLNDINPNEIETVTILKDAAAAAIYGVRASNGVIIIDRKKGVEGNAKFALRSTVGIRPREDYSRYRYEKDGSVNLNYLREAWKDGTDPFFASLLGYEEAGFLPFLSLSYGGSDEALNLLADKSLGKIDQQQMELGFAQLSAYNNAKDYQKYFLRDAVTQQYNLNVSGGTKNALYYLTGNYLGNRLSQQNNDNRKVQFSGRTNLALSKKVSLELLTDYNQTIGNTAPVPDINNIYPYERFADSNGDPLAVKAGSFYAGSRYTAATIPMGFLDQRMYPLTELNEVSTRQRIADYRATANFRYNIGKGLDFSLGGIYESSQLQQRHYSSENSAATRQLINFFVEPGAAQTRAIYNLPKGGYLQQQESLLSSYTTRAQFNYNTQISANHSINAIMGTELRKEVTQGSRSAAFGYSDQTLQQQPTDYSRLFNSGNGFNTSYSLNSAGTYSDLFAQSYNDDRFVSAYMNVVYSYMNRYSLTGSIRIDQSNLFGTDPKYRYKPLWSLGAGWNLEREGFMQPLTWVNALKLRIARGFNGNISKASLPQVIAQYNLNDVNLPLAPALYLSSPANSGLRWEQTDNFNLGLDYTILASISGSIDYYNKRSTDVLGRIDIDPFRGVTPALVNQASISNKGLEFTLNADWIRHRKLNWNTGLVISHNNSKVLEAYVPSAALGQSLYSEAVITAAAGGYMKGQAVGNIYSYRYAGIDVDGNALYYDTKGDRVTLFDGTDEGFGSLESRGSTIPATNLGLSNRVDIGDFYFYCMVNYYGGFVVRKPLPNPGAARPIEGAGDYWRQPGDETTVSLPSSTYNSFYGPTYLANSDRFVLNGAYLTVGDVTVSYNLRNLALLKKAGLSNCEVKLQASNIYTVGFNGDNFSIDTGSYLKRYITPTYTIGLFTNF